MRVIVTGGCGFIGSSFVHLLYERQISMLVVDKLTYAGNRDNIPADVEFLQKDICDVTAEDLGEYDYLVNFAAESHVDNSIKDGRPFIRTNVEGTFNLLELARNNVYLKKFVQISTDEVYGDLDWLKKDKSVETDSLHPSSYYSATKASADLLVESVSKTWGFGFNYLITRTCNNFGERQHPEKLVPKMIQCVKDGTPIPIYGDGMQQREWIWVEDNVRAIYELMVGNHYGIYNIGTGMVHTNLDLVPKFRMEQYKPVRVEFVTDRLGHDRRYTLNSDKYHHSLKETPRYHSIIHYIYSILNNLRIA